MLHLSRWIGLSIVLHACTSDTVRGRAFVITDQQVRMEIGHRWVEDCDEPHAAWRAMGPNLEGVHEVTLTPGSLLTPWESTIEEADGRCLIVSVLPPDQEEIALWVDPREPSRRGTVSDPPAATIELQISDVSGEMWVLGKAPPLVGGERPSECTDQRAETPLPYIPSRGPETRTVVAVEPGTPCTAYTLQDEHGTTEDHQLCQLPFPFQEGDTLWLDRPVFGGSDGSMTDGTTTLIVASDVRHAPVWLVPDLGPPLFPVCSYAGSVGHHSQVGPDALGWDASVELSTPDGPALAVFHRTSAAPGVDTLGLWRASAIVPYLP